MKALHSIFVTEPGMLMVCREVQPSKALPPISVTESGMLMVFKAVQSLKALHSIFVTEPGILTEVTDLFFMPLRIEPVSSKIKIGSVMVIMDFVYAKIMKKNGAIAGGVFFN